MRYVFISDVHGHYDKMIAALNAVNFNKEKDTLVSLGDLFDRGLQSKEVLQYVMNCPNRILVYGNHEIRLQRLFMGAHKGIYDNHNGIRETLQSFCDMDKKPNVYWGMLILRQDDHCREIRTLLREYFIECVFAVEFSDLIGTHAWFPANWRNTSAWEWAEATASDTKADLKAENYPDKNAVFGHYFAWMIAQMFEERDEHNVSIYQHHCGEKCFTFIDGDVTEDYGVVNTFVYESDETPIVYPQFNGKVSGVSLK